jgi:aminoglycoside N3'-acetyltransferase
MDGTKWSNIPQDKALTFTQTDEAVRDYKRVERTQKPMFSLVYFGSFESDFKASSIFQQATLTDN